MKVNPGFFVSKLLRFLNRPALRDCRIDKTARVGTGSNCIAVRMGRYSYMGKNNSCCNVEIGAFCSIASYCAIGGGAHDLGTVSTSPVFHTGRNCFGVNLGGVDTKLNAPVTIGSDVWIGEGAFISDGVTVGTGAVIGAHSVVTHDVPPYAVAAGAPARVLRYRFDGQTRERLLASQWWQWPEERLKELDFSAPDRFLAAIEVEK